MAAPRAWVLNLDADVELGARAGYTPSRRVEGAMRAHRERLAATLLAADDLLIDGTCEPDGARGMPGVAFCPTPRAIGALLRAGAVPEPHPDVSVLRRVNSRAFASSLGETLPGAAFLTDVDEAIAKLSTAPPLGTGWRVKYAFGMTGRNQRVVTTARPDDVAFVRRGIEIAGVQIEPNVELLVEYAIHGHVAQDGVLASGSVVQQRCDARGAWLATERIESSPLAETEGVMRSELRRVATALHDAGYFGPFGIDAFTYRGVDGATYLQPRSEINARYSMGFAIGFGPPR